MPAGQRLLARVSLSTRQLDLAEQELDEAMCEQQGQVRIAITPYITLGFLGQAFRRFRQRYPKVELELIEGLVSRALPAGEFQSETLLRERQHVVVHAGHPVLADPSPQALSRLEWRVTGPRDPLKPGLLRAMFEQVGIPGPSRIVFCDTLAGMTLLREADVVGLMPEPLLRLPEGRGITAMPELEPAEFHVRLRTREDVPQTPAAAYLAHCLLDACCASGQACVS
ncbi:MAG: HTH-type transcriptional regulator GbpR [Pseudomonadota bacterium]|jgi:DNA-binding transcriptional LysR family regulator